MDAMLQKAYPLIAAPHETALSWPEKDGVRYINARDGLWQEVHSSWVSIRHRIGPSIVNLPFGAMVPEVRWHCSLPPVQLWRDFIKEAQKALPNESAALLVWNSVENTWRLAMRGASLQTAGRIDYINPELGDDEVGVVDLHSHGTFGAFFSKRDDKDDAGSFKISVVFGKLNQSVPEIVMRFSLMSRFVDLKLNAEGDFEFPDEALM